MLVIVLININQMIDGMSALYQEQSERTKTTIQENSEANIVKISKFYEDALVTKAINLLERDFLVLRGQFADNSIGWISNFLYNTYQLDGDLIHASFIAIQGDQPVVWYLINDRFPKGISLQRSSFDTGTKTLSGVSGSDNISIPYPTLQTILTSDGPRIKLLQQGNKEIEVYDVSTPIFDGDLSEFQDFKDNGEPIGFLHYQLTLKNMMASIESERKQAENAVNAQEEETQRLSERTQSLGDDLKIRSMMIVAGSGFIIIVLGLVTINLVTSAIIRPIVDLKDGAHRIAEGDYSTPLKATTNDEIGSLSRNFEFMRVQVKTFTDDLQGLVDARTQELKIALDDSREQRQKIAEIMEKIEQGILTFDQSFKIEPEYSGYLEKLFQLKEKEIVGQNVFDTLFANHQTSKDSWDQMKQSIQCSFKEEPLTWQINADHLIRDTRVVIDHEIKTFELDWTPIERDGLVERVMLSIRDLTEQKEMERRAKEADQENERMLRVISHYIQYDQKRTKQFLSQTIPRIEALDLFDDKRRVLRSLHTLKGDARVARFDDLAESIHRAESTLKAEDSAESTYNEMISSLKTLWLRDLNHYYKTIQLITSQDEKQDEQAKTILGAIDGVLTDLSDYVSKEGFWLESFSLSDEIITWKPAGLTMLTECIMHGLNNSVDHGYILAKKGDPHQPAGINLDVFTKRENDLIVIDIIDHGAGIDPKFAEHRAKSLGFVPNENETIFDVLFLDEVSSQTQATSRSGRGVGLAAVREIITELGGTASISSENGMTILRLKVPSDQLLTGRRQENQSAS